MNHLWVRLSLAFSLVVVISFLSVVLVIRLTVQMITERTDFHEEIAQGLQTALADYYAINQSWDGVEDALTVVEDTLTSNPRNVLEIILTNDNGSIIFGSAETDNPEPFDHPIVYADRTVGYISVIAPAKMVLRRPPEPPYLFEFLLLTAIAGSIAGALLGVLMSRSLTAPLASLAATAAALGAKDWHQRAEVKGTSEIVKLAQSFNDMAAALETNERLRRNLIADVAHELRTPLVALQGNLYAILDDVYPLSKSEIANLYDQSRLLSRLVEDLQELSLAEARQLPMDQVETEVQYIIERAVTTFQPVAASKNVELSAHYPDSTAFALVDPARISQVLHNLLNNALTHTPSGGKITLTLCHTASEVTIAVSDTGEGIPAEHQPYVFERFYRADKARSRHTGGAGLGLAIAKAIIESHGGQISVTSAGIPGEGTTFIIRLPRCAPSLEGMLHEAAR